MQPPVCLNSRWLLTSVQSARFPVHSSRPKHSTTLTLRMTQLKLSAKHQRPRPAGTISLRHALRYVPVHSTSQIWGFIGCDQMFLFCHEFVPPAMCTAFAQDSGCVEYELCWHHLELFQTSIVALALSALYVQHATCLVTQCTINKKACRNRIPRNNCHVKLLIQTTERWLLMHHLKLLAKQL